MVGVVCRRRVIPVVIGCSGAVLMITQPCPGEVCTFTDAETLKPAALLFDRVFLLGDRNHDVIRRVVRGEIPAELVFAPDESALAHKDPCGALLAGYVRDVQLPHDGIGRSTLLPEMGGALGGLLRQAWCHNCAVLPLRGNVVVRLQAGCQHELQCRPREYSSPYRTMSHGTRYCSSEMIRKPSTSTGASRLAP